MDDRSVVVALVLLVALAACRPDARDVRSAAADVASSASTATPGSAPPAAVPVVSLQPLTARAATYHVEVEAPVVAGIDRDVAATITEHARAWTEARVATFAADDAELVVAGASAEGFPPGLLEIRATTGAPTARLLSIAFTVTAMHQGMAHPSTEIEAFTYDLATGRTLELVHLFAPGQDVHATLSERAVAALLAQLDPTDDGWAEAGVREGAGPDDASLRRFVVDADGLTLHFDQYQVAPGAAGPQAVTLGWDGLLEALEPSPLLAAALRR